MSSVREICAASTTGINWWRNDRLPLPDDDFYIRWGCTSNLPRGKEHQVLNESKAIHAVADKLEFRRTLQDNGELCPKTWFDKHLPHDVGQVVIRTRNHHQGRGLWVYHSNDLDLGLMMIKLGPNGFYVNELINKVREYRVFMVSGRVVCVAEKTPGNPDDVAWNVAKGGRFDNVRWGNWPNSVCRIAVQAFNLSGLDFGGVDVMVDEEGKCYVLEINSAPSLTSPYRQLCMAKAFDYIVEKGKDFIPLNDEHDYGWRKYIHPAVKKKKKRKE